MANCLDAICDNIDLIHLLIPHTNGIYTCKSNTLPYTVGQPPSPELIDLIFYILIYNDYVHLIALIV